QVNQISGIVTAKFKVTKTTSTNPGYCELVKDPAANNTIKCQFDASDSGPTELITGYKFSLNTTAPVVLGQSRVVKDPPGPCNLRSQTTFPLNLTPTVSFAGGSVTSEPQQVFFIKVGAC